MAKPTRSSLSLLTIALIISLFHALPIAQSRILQGEAKKATLECLRVYGVQEGDTCFTVENTFKTSEASFDLMNPNLNCSALFVGQWLCIKAELNEE